MKNVISKILFVSFKMQTQPILSKIFRTYKKLLVIKLIFDLIISYDGTGIYKMKIKKTDFEVRTNTAA